MAHLEKYIRAQLPHLLKHDERAKSKNGDYIKFKNESIDTARTHLNYNLHERNDGISDYEYIKKRAEQYLARNVVKRDNINWAGSWVITLPESLKEAHMSEQRRFFETATRFLEKRYGYDNIVGAYVHNDETTPHIHVKVTPVFWDAEKEKHRHSAKEFFNLNDLKTFHKDLSKAMFKEFGFDVGVYDESKSRDLTKASYKTVSELKHATRKAEQHLQASIEEANRIIDSKNKTIRELEERALIQKHQLENVSVKDKVKLMLQKEESEQVLQLADKIADKRTKDLHDQLFLVADERNKAVSANKGLRDENDALKKEVRYLEREKEKLRQSNRTLLGMVKTFQYSIDKMKKFFSKSWSRFIDDYRATEPTSFKEFNELRADMRVNGKGAEYEERVYDDFERRDGKVKEFNNDFDR